MGFFLTGREIRNKGHTFYETKCTECNALKMMRKDRVNLDTKCNAIRHTRPDLALQLDDSENEFNYSIRSEKIAKWKCMHCQSVFTKKVKDVTLRGLNCPVCSIKISYPNRYMYALLQNVGICFDREKSFEWSEGKRYDFYLPYHSTIIEMNGLQHYKDKNNGSCWNYNGLESVRNNDKHKRDLAIKNGIENYIVINASISDFDYIVQSIKGSELPSICNIQDKDYIIAGKNVETNSLFREIINRRNNGDFTRKIASDLGLSVDTVISIVKKASDLGFVSYDANEERRKYAPYLHENNKKKIMCLNDKKIHNSINEAAEYYGLSPKAVSNCINGRSKSCRSKKEKNKKLYFKLMED